MLKLKEDEPGVFSLTGEYAYREPIYKTVTVDGEIYHKTSFRDSVWFPEKAEHRDYVTLNIEPLKLEYKIKHYREFYLSIYKKACPYGVSENENVALYEVLFHNKKLDKRIKYLCCGKRERNFDIFKYRLSKESSIYIDLFRYGFNNVVSIGLSLKDFILIKDKQSIFNYNDLKWSFDRLLNIDIDTISPFEFAQKIMKYKIQQKKYDKNYV